jgi:proton translocating ATP synthase F1 alpha subunit
MKNLLIINSSKLKKFKLSKLDLSYYLLNSENSTTPQGLYRDFGEVTKLADGIAEIVGFNETIKFGEVVYFKGLKSLSGMVMSLTPKSVSAVLFFNIRSIKEGDYVIPSGKLVSISVGKSLFGRIIDAFGNAIDIYNSVTFIKPKYQKPVDSKAAGISLRDAVYEPMLTGQLIIDAITPIGLGQRELIIGDRQSGKTTAAWDTLMNQCNDQYHFFIYSFVGQKRSFVARITRKYASEKWYQRAIFIASTCSEPAPLQYLSSFSACAVSEVIGTFSSDAVVAYDDLTKQSLCYRQVSLLLRRPPGREAFPGDVFYLHSRLLERAVKFHALSGAGSSTALPIVETQLGDVSAYIPTNIISITDGQMFFDNESFKKGIRPALDVNLSVSRVGSICQWPIMRKLSSELKISLALYKEVEVYASFAADLDAATIYVLNRGSRLIELLKQQKHQPLSRDQEILLLFAGVKGYLDEIAKESISEFKKFLLDFASRTNIFFDLNPYKPVVDYPFEVLMSEVLKR